MRPALSLPRDVGEFNRVDRAVRSLEEEWRLGGADLDGHWARYEATGSLSVLAALIKADLRCRSERGECPSVGGYLDRYPALRDRSDRVLSLIYEEFCLREERGEQPDPEQFCARYPSWSDSLASQLEYHRMLSKVIGLPTPPHFPEPGDRFQEFLLIETLGKGGSAHVYLALEEAVGGRKVALKISPDRGQEAATQGRLDHPNIVPVHSVVVDRESRMRGLCMPYRAGLPLDVVIRRVGPPSRPAGARVLWEAVVGSIEGADDDPAEPSVPWTGFPIAGTYADGVAWIVAQLARALAYVHARGVMHRDLKPANVLLTLKAGPQLLDFNLSHNPHSLGQAEATLIGGTLPYMAPEQLDAFLTKCWDGVKAGADLYSLGLVLVEFLTGRPPETHDPTIPLPRAVRDLLDRRVALKVDLQPLKLGVPHALEAIAARCLTFAPEDRYASAEALADDLQRFLDRRPLQHVANPSRRERCRNLVGRRWKEMTALSGGLTLAGLLIFQIMIAHLIPCEHRAKFLAAVRSVEAERDLSRASETMRAMADAYPGSPLPLFYQSILLARLNDAQGCDTNFARALQVPGAAETLAPWLAKHPVSRKQLEAFGISWITDRNFDLATRGFKLARAAEPSSMKALYGLAKVNSFDARKLPLAREQMDEVIRTTVAADRRDEVVALRYYYQFRAEIAVRQAEQEMQRPALVRATGEVFAHLDGALADLGLGRPLFDPRDHDLKFQYDSTQAEALIARGDANAETAHLDAAEADYRAAEAVIDQMDPVQRRETDRRIWLTARLRESEGRHPNVPTRARRAGRLAPH